MIESSSKHKLVKSKTFPNFESNSITYPSEKNSKHIQIGSGCVNISLKKKKNSIFPHSLCVSHRKDMNWSWFS